MNCVFGDNQVSFIVFLFENVKTHVSDEVKSDAIVSVHTLVCALAKVVDKVHMNSVGKMIFVSYLCYLSDAIYK